MEQRLLVKFVTKWPTDDCDEYEYETESFADNEEGLNSAMALWQRHEESSGGASLERQQYNPDYIVDPPHHLGAWETIEQWDFAEWAEPYAGLCE